MGFGTQFDQGQSGSPSVKADPNLGSIAAQRPNTAARGYVKNLLLEETGNPDYPDLITFPFRPSPVNVETSVNDDTLDVLGMSHQYDTYMNTANATVSFEVYQNALMMIKETTSENLKEGGKSLLNQMSAEIEKQRRFLQALLYPGITPAGVVGAQQPPCILCLPGIVTFRCKLKSLGEVHERVDIDGNIVELRMSVSFKEAPMARVSMEDVLMNGMFRTWGE